MLSIYHLTQPRAEPEGQILSFISLRAEMAAPPLLSLLPSANSAERIILLKLSPPW